MNSTAARDSRPTWQLEPASPAQFQLISDMAKERGINVADIFRRPENRQEATTIITWLKAQPKTEAPSPSASAQDRYAGVAPVGKSGKAHSFHYAIEAAGEIKFYRVKRGRKAGVFFVDVQASDDYYPIRNYGQRDAILSVIAQDPKAALARYGQLIGQCGRCGRTLTSEYRELGIGPVCIDK